MNLYKKTAVCLSGLFLASCSNNDPNIPDRITSREIGTEIIDGAECSFYRIGINVDGKGQGKGWRIGTAMICKNADGTSTTLKRPDGPKGQTGETVMRYEAN